jgi:hypothetical protein
VGLEAPQETHQVYRPFNRLAPEQRSVGRRKCGHEGSRVLRIHQRRGQEVSSPPPFLVNIIDLLLFSFRPAPTFWGEKLPFGTVCGEFSSPAGGWVHTVAFSPSGDVLAFAGKSIVIVSYEQDV